MRVSPNKRAANRLNALKSTGPKTASGKGVSAQNATRHGLSVPLPPQLVDPVHQQVVQLIMSDGFDHEIAHNLAEKIIDYERNILYLNEIFQNDIVLANDPRSKTGAAVVQQELRQEELVSIPTDIEQQQREVKNRTLLQALNHAKKACKTMIRAEKNLEVNRIGASQRYFKRASNQLIKALRRL